MLLKNRMSERMWETGPSAYAFRQGTKMSGPLTRRQLMRAAVAGLAPVATVTRAKSAPAGSILEGRLAAPAGMAAVQTAEIGPYPNNVLPAGVRSRFVHNINGLRMHLLEAGFEGSGRPGVLLLHGFPELAYS